MSISWQYVCVYGGRVMCDDLPIKAARDRCQELFPGRQSSGVCYHISVNCVTLGKSLNTVCISASLSYQEAILDVPRGPVLCWFSLMLSFWPVPGFHSLISPTSTMICLFCSDIPGYTTYRQLISLSQSCTGWVGLQAFTDPRILRTHS